MMAPTDECGAIGCWRITQADLRDQNYSDLSRPATLLIPADGRGEIAFHFHKGDQAILTAVRI